MSATISADAARHPRNSSLASRRIYRSFSSPTILPPSSEMQYKVACLVSLLPQALGAAVLRPVTLPQTQDRPAPSSNIPLLIWHGLGDAFDADGIKSVGELYQDIYPDAAVYAVHLADDTNGDRQATWLGNVNDQISQVCDALGEEPLLATASAVNAVGFSQGGQFLRGLVERCNRPPVRNLLTFGSQHNGISEYQTCNEGNWFCQWVNGVARGNTWGWAQTHLVPAQYYRDPADLDAYLENSNFLADINNERNEKSGRYIQNLESLNRFVMVMFSNDTTVVPRESSWFAEKNQTTGNVTYLRDLPIYKEDWLGLKTLDKQGALIFETTEGPHMNITEPVLRESLKKWFDPNSRKKPSDALGWLQRLSGHWIVDQEGL